MTASYTNTRDLYTTADMQRMIDAIKVVYSTIRIPYCVHRYWRILSHALVTSWQCSGWKIGPVRHPYVQQVQLDHFDCDQRTGSPIRRDIQRPVTLKSSILAQKLWPLIRGRSH